MSNLEVCFIVVSVILLVVSCKGLFYVFLDIMRAKHQLHEKAW